MTHYLLDSNTLLRYLRKDVPKQGEQVVALFTHAKQSQAIITIPVAVILEVVFVLSKFYGEPREVIGAQLFTLASSPILDIEKRDIVKKALLIWKIENMSFVDCLVLAQAQEEGKELFTFDKRLQKIAKNTLKKRM